ncbi:hypothetical protein [Enterococcus faecalis]|uniref:hypothetical protein n=1 Tax=Enterococcus faecalis TaxID=1351 RepID=UPI001E3E08AC|nr:hypothetical protein [Enterococcus faecalis]MCD4907097.1 hypothetical protein [Enterococcus faecalis]
MEDVEKTPEELANEEKLAGFLGEEVKKDVEEENPTDPVDPIEEEPTPAVIKKLNPFEFVYTQEGNVLMSDETYQKIMAKFF